jgi:hypothetical protein
MQAIRYQVPIQNQHPVTIGIADHNEYLLNLNGVELSFEPGNRIHGIPEHKAVLGDNCIAAASILRHHNVSS